MKPRPSNLRPSHPRDNEPDANAFIHSSRHSNDDLAEALGEQFLSSATSGEEAGEDAMNVEVTEEAGGPFVITSAGSEFAEGTDSSNPRGAKRAPVPSVMRGS